MQPDLLPLVCQVWAHAGLGHFQYWLSNGSVSSWNQASLFDPMLGHYVSRVSAEMGRLFCEQTYFSRRAEFGSVLGQIILIAWM